MRALLPLIVSMALASTACLDNHNHQTSIKTFEDNAFFPDGSGARMPPEGTIPMGKEKNELSNNGYPKQYQVNREFIAGGRNLYESTCMVCHGMSGKGDGIVTTRGLLPPPDFLEKRLKDSAPSEFYQVMVKGSGRMPSYARRLDEKEKWQISAYLKALQLSRSISIRRLNEEDRKFFFEDAAP